MPVITGQFVTVTIAGTAPRSFFDEAPTASQIQAAITGALQSDGFQVRSVQVAGGAAAGPSGGALPFQGDASYTATITVIASGDFGAPDDVGLIVAHDVGVAVGQYPTTIGSASVSSSGPVPVIASSGSVFDTLATALQTDVRLVILGLVALAALAIVILAPELKRSVGA